ncbi:sodium/potassium/calcium exchanger Nckx30C isoform X3 [Stomoxys calcitrans]|uniref:sodium/potassium/calcium exchanger Nckx30C isoform X3 n=1 Tax=Stomoxys calcitrans TaxID=35570 RepID=UPI0027E21A10|nr:sodium/potassium/calcium exchanger Nckx30C isoform X3 [Stomoxys calcitrans]
MLQQPEATCLQQPTLATKSSISPQQQHEILGCYSKNTFLSKDLQGITFSPSPKRAKSESQHLKVYRQTKICSNNVALHSWQTKEKQPQQLLSLAAEAGKDNILTLNQGYGPNAQTKYNFKSPKARRQGLPNTPLVRPPTEDDEDADDDGEAEHVKEILFPTLLNMKAQNSKLNPSLLTESERPQSPPTMLLRPQQHMQQRQQQSKIKAIPKPIKESLDFNSRRRRGRLRSAMRCRQDDNENVTATANGKSDQEQELKAKAARSNVPATFVVCVNNVAKQLTTLLLTMLLSFLSLHTTFVNKIQKNIKIVLSTTTTITRKTATPLTKTTATASSSLSSLSSSSSSSLSSASCLNNKIWNKSRKYSKELENPKQEGALKAAGKYSDKNVASKPKSRTKTTPSAITAWLKTLSSSSTSSTSSPTLSSLTAPNLLSRRLLYAFLFVSIILVIPSHDHMVSAAKPKSATQLQHNQQQQPPQHNQQQHEQQQHHHKPNVVYAAGADNVHIDKEGMLLTPPSYQGVSSQTSNEDDTEYLTDSVEEQLFDDEKQNMNIVEEEEEAEERERNGSFERDGNETHADNTTKTPLFPKDLFTKEQLENGAVICHIIGVIYMFVALAIVCDEFFVPSLDVIIEKLGITDDVAGATFMAAGGSAPELFTSVIGVFVSFDDVGIGTIVGSAVFNILFVIGMCALFSRTVLSLTWWPLFRDCSFYSVSLLVLIYFFRDNRIWWWEALILFCIYIAYVGFMKWNVQVESCVKRLITKNKGNAANSSETSMATQPGGSVTSRAASETRSGPPGSSSGAGTTGNSSGGNASTTQTGAKFRHGLLQLMIHTIDPLHDDDVPGKVDEKATQLHAIASLKVLLDATKPQRGGATTSAANHVKINLKETTLADRPNGNIDTTLDSPSLSGRRASWIDQRVKIQTRKFSIKQTQEIEDEPEPLNMSWPDTARKRLTYILVAPLLIPMWLTLPDTRTPKGKKLFPITFIGSIMWIAAFSYLMVWWANVAGDTARIPPEVMGLTFLAAGTSIPDLITSVIVARKGFGDMAVSSSVGSNIFDVTVGLPIPWLLYGIIYDAPVEVNSVGMVCSITILFMMLLFVVMSIACFRWRMNKGLGFTMFLLYFVFVAVSLMFEYDVITCPV